ncbi:hypothetical protein [Vibrio mediterranei]|uniref:hypothetical protein n=1 Tax=Vibrio mediterranei TaxID=689 RepID=UPI0040675860
MFVFYLPVLVIFCGLFVIGEYFELSRVVMFYLVSAFAIMAIPTPLICAHRAISKKTQLLASRNESNLDLLRGESDLLSFEYCKRSSEMMLLKKMRFLSTVVGRNYEVEIFKGDMPLLGVESGRDATSRIKVSEGSLANYRQEELAFQAVLADLLLIETQNKKSNENGALGNAISMLFLIRRIEMLNSVSSENAGFDISSIDSLLALTD